MKKEAQAQGFNPQATNLLYSTGVPVQIRTLARNAISPIQTPADTKLLSTTCPLGILSLQSGGGSKGPGENQIDQVESIDVEEWAVDNGEKGEARSTGWPHSSCEAYYCMEGWW